MNKTFFTGNRVRVGYTNTVPARYRGRVGTVVGYSGTSSYLVGFEGRRVNPLPVRDRFLRLD